MRAFIIRPFGTKEGVNFDDVEAKLIGPALDQLGIAGRTTGDILRQGNIRTDMFQRLLTADLVIADLSIHNANVFYELGIRHALRDKRTFLLRARIDAYPFDLQTDRYLDYDKDNPAGSLSKLVEALRQTMASENKDSPVFQLLPDLQAQDRSRFLPVPRGFREDVERAERKKQLGDLELLGEEARGFDWESEGLRLVGRAQTSLKAYEGARSTWEAVRELDGDDVEANWLLSTIYQRLGDLASSDQAIQRFLNKAMAPRQRAEAHALRGSNEKERLRSEWKKISGKGAAVLEARREKALCSPYLKLSYQSYERGFSEDLSHYYSGLNALAMLTILVELATTLPDIWKSCSESDEKAQLDLQSYKDQIGKLSAAVELSIASEQQRLARADKSDPWVEISAADLACLTATRSARVANLYDKALKLAPSFASDSVRKQLSIFQELSILTTNVQAALSVLPPATSTPVVATAQRILLFTGHRIDVQDRLKPRFPAGKEAVAREKIREAISEERKLSGSIAYGLAGGASGGDILFHEVCAEMDISTKLYLALPRDQFVTASVQDAGPEWIERFNALHKKLPSLVLSEKRELPPWLQGKQKYSIWQRNNLWILHHALSEVGGANVTLIALWNGEAGDGPGGTADMIAQAKRRGAKTIILDTKQLFGLA